MRLGTLPALFLVAALAAGCPKARTSAATQPNGPKLFDPAASDPKAVTLVDGMITALGGQAAWDAAHEIAFDETIQNGDNVVLAVKHIWDRWNGRHHYEMKNTGGQLMVAGYDMYEGTGFAKANGHETNADQKAEIIGMAKKRFGQDVYYFLLPYRLKDPGVHLGKPEEEGEPGKPTTDPPKWDSIKVTFDAGVGTGDTYYVWINKETHLPDFVHMVPAGKPDDFRLIYQWTDWVTVGGLKFSTKRLNQGIKEESITYANVEVHANPNVDNYVPVVQ